MSDVSMIIWIAVFWFLIGITFSAIATDNALAEISNEGNFSYTPQNPNYNLSDLDTEGNTATSLGSSWLSEFGKMFLFRIGDNAGFPKLISVIIGFVNWLLVFIMIILGYRLIRHGGG